MQKLSGATLGLALSFAGFSARAESESSFARDLQNYVTAYSKNKKSSLTKLHRQKVIESIFAQPGGVFYNASLNSIAAESKNNEALVELLWQSETWYQALYRNDIAKAQADALVPDLYTNGVFNVAFSLSFFVHSVTPMRKYMATSARWAERMGAARYALYAAPVVAVAASEKIKSSSLQSRIAGLPKSPAQFYGSFHEKFFPLEDMNENLQEQANRLQLYAYSEAIALPGLMYLGDKVPENTLASRLSNPCTSLVTKLSLLERNVLWFGKASGLYAKVSRYVDPFQLMGGIFGVTVAASYLNNGPLPVEPSVRSFKEAVQQFNEIEKNYSQDLFRKQQATALLSNRTLKLFNALESQKVALDAKYLNKGMELVEHNADDESKIAAEMKKLSEEKSKELSKISTREDLDKAFYAEIKKQAEEGSQYVFPEAFKSAVLHHAGFLALYSESLLNRIDVNSSELKSVTDLKWDFIESHPPVHIVAGESR